MSSTTIVLPSSNFSFSFVLGGSQMRNPSTTTGATTSSEELPPGASADQDLYQARSCKSQFSRASAAVKQKRSRWCRRKLGLICRAGPLRNRMRGIPGGDWCGAPVSEELRAPAVRAVVWTSTGDERSRRSVGLDVEHQMVYVITSGPRCVRHKTNTRSEDEVMHNE